MCIDVIDLFGRELRSLENMAHQASLALLRRLWKMVAVGVRLHGNDLRIDLRSTFDGCRERFDHHYSTTMSRNKALPMDVPGPAGDLGPIIESLIRDRTHQRHRMEFNRREIQHCACDNCSRRTVMANLVYSATKG